MILLFGLSLFVRTAYLQNNLVPSATDLGHHMYWTKVIVEKGIIPNYEKSDVIVSPAGDYSISAPQNISDFVIGEHLPFAAIALISGISVVSWFPTVSLLLINMLTLLAIFILTLGFLKMIRGAKTSPWQRYCLSDRFLQLPHPKPNSWAVESLATSLAIYLFP